MTVQLDRLENRIFKHFFELSPRMAVGFGLHEYDGRLPDISNDGIRKWSRIARDLLEQIRTLHRADLDKERKLDVVCLENMLERTLFDIEQLHTYSSRPTIYSLQLSAVPYVSRDYAPIDQRIKALATHLRNIPVFLEQAENNLDRTLAKPINDVAIIQITGVLRDLDRQAAAEASKASPKIQEEFKEARKTGETAIQIFLDQLSMKHNMTPEFALGKDKFDKILKINDKMDLSIDRILQLGFDDLKSNLERLRQTAEKLAPGRSIEEVGDKIHSNHPRAENLITDTARMLDELKQYLLQKSLVFLPDETNLLVTPTPAQMRGTTTAAMNSPGPFEKPGA